MQKTYFFQLISRTFAYPFKDPQWVRKLSIALGITLANFIVPIIPAILMSGYCMRIMQRIINGDGEPYLPEWNDWEKLLRQGVKLWGAGMIFSMPLSLIIFAAFLLLSLAFFGQILFIRSDGSLASGGSAILIAAVIIFFLIMLIVSVLSWVIGILMPPALGHLAAKDSFRAAFRFGEWWPVLKRSFGSYLIIILISITASMIYLVGVQVLSFTFVLIFLVPFLMLFYLLFVNLYSYTFYALAYREGLETAIP